MENEGRKTLGIITEGGFDVNMKRVSRCQIGKIYYKDGFHRDGFYTDELNRKTRRIRKI